MSDKDWGQSIYYMYLDVIVLEKLVVPVFYRVPYKIHKYAILVYIRCHYILNQ